VKVATQAQTAASSGDIPFLDWFRGNQRRATITGLAILAIGAGIWFWWSAKSRRETFAARALQAARSSAEAGNLPLAASDLAKLVATYSGTVAGDEATILLAQVRLLQNQGPLAVADLKKFVAGNPHPQFRGPAYQLLGSSLEEVGQYADASKAYTDAAAAFDYKPLRAQSLIDAGRGYWLAGDTAQAARSYERILSEFSDQPSVLEARIRLAELRKSAAPLPAQPSK